MNTLRTTKVSFVTVVIEGSVTTVGSENKRAPDACTYGQTDRDTLCVLQDFDPTKTAAQKSRSFYMNITYVNNITFALASCSECATKMFCAKVGVDSSPLISNS